MVRPSSIALRTFIKASSSTALPEVLAVMLKPSRIGTPDVIKVPRVRVKRATAIFLQKHPQNRHVQQHLVEVVASLRIFRIWRTPKNTTAIPTKKNHQN